MSTPRRSAQRRSATSFSDIAGTLTATPGQVDALVVADAAALDDPGDDAGVVDLDGLERDLAVVDEDRVAGAARRRAGPCRSSSRCRCRPATSSVVIVKVAPGLEDDRARRRTCRAGSSGPAGRRGCRRRARRRRPRRGPTRRPLVVGVRRRGERFIRATSMPASTSRRSPPGWRRRGRGCRRSWRGARGEPYLRAVARWVKTGCRRGPRARTRDSRTAGQTTSGRAVGGIGAGRVGAAGQPAVDARGRGAALGDRPDDERLAATGVAGHEDARRRWSCTRRRARRCRARRARRRAARAAARAPGR